MSLWDYMIFDKIVETGSLREAADALHLTPAAVSHSLGKLKSVLPSPCSSAAGAA